MVALWGGAVSYERGTPVTHQPGLWGRLLKHPKPEGTVGGAFDENADAAHTLVVGVVGVLGTYKTVTARYKTVKAKGTYKTARAIPLAERSMKTPMPHMPSLIAVLVLAEDGADILPGEDMRPCFHASGLVSG